MMHPDLLLLYSDVFRLLRVFEPPSAEQFMVSPRHEGQVS